MDISELSWLVVWFADGSTAKIDNTPEQRARLNLCLGDEYVTTANFDCLDKAEIVVRTSYIVGFTISTPESRQLDREFSAALKTEEDQSSSWS